MGVNILSTGYVLYDVNMVKRFASALWSECFVPDNSESYSLSLFQQFSFVTKEC